MCIPRWPLRGWPGAPQMFVEIQNSFTNCCRCVRDGGLLLTFTLVAHPALAVARFRAGCCCRSGAHLCDRVRRTSVCTCGGSGNRVTWLILPVVICLPQGLSHASLSVSIYIVKLHTAHYISNYLFDGKFYYMDTRSNSRANTCVKFSFYRFFLSH